MTRATQDKAVVYNESEFWIIGPSFYMMSNKIASHLSACLANIIITFKNSLSPFCIFLGMAQSDIFGSYSTFPARTIWATLDSALFNHGPSYIFAVFWRQTFSLIPRFLPWLELSRITPSWKFTIFESKIRAPFQFGGDFLANFGALFPLPITRRVALA